MAVKYLSGNRIWGTNAERLALGGTTTDPSVANSVFLVNSPTWQEDSNGHISYNTVEDEIDFSTDGSGVTASYATFDLQHEDALDGSNASDTEWVLRFKLDLTDYVSGHGSSSALVVGISNQGTSNGQASQNGIGFEVGCGTSDTVYRLQTANGVSWARGSADALFDETPADDEITWVEVKRTLASAVTVSMYSADTYDLGDLLEAESITGMSGTTGLRYVSVKSDSQSRPENTNIGTVSDINFWNDTTTTTRTLDPNLPNGTIFITSDTNVHYMWNGTDTWNEVA